LTVKLTVDIVRDMKDKNLLSVEENILKFAQTHTKFKTSEVVRGLGSKYSRTYISNKINLLHKKGLLVSAGSGPHVYYALPSRVDALSDRAHRRVRNIELKEHEIMEDLIRKTPFLTNLKDSLSSIFDYAFSEMLNNAIEHSKSKWIETSVEENGVDLTFIIRDFGIGVFRSVKGKRKLKSELAAIQDLLKGKVTTQPQSHSGEGIFFTSKVADTFTLESYEYQLKIDNKIRDIFVGEIKSVKGTKVIFEISLRSDRHLNDVFRNYQSEPGSYAFDKTEVHIRLYKMGTVHVSRSQARRVLAGLDKFKKVVLDFDRVPAVGQAFVDEIFRVFVKKHPKITLISINTNDAVKFMIGRVK
jgi:anti-sigma regulatory factor (Ser/Thr protein kinase)